MHRLACVDLQDFALQLLFADRPDWRSHPTVVVADDRPQARVLFANTLAQRQKILPGARYSSALSLSGSLRAGVISPDRLHTGVDTVTQLLRRYSPTIEASLSGTFWLDARGLGSLFSTATAWGRDISHSVTLSGFSCVVVVGWSRFDTAAIARSLTSAQSPLVFRTPREESSRARRVSLCHAGFTPALRDSLHKLGVTTLGGFVSLPAESVRRRFGNQAHSLHRLASGAQRQQLEPTLEALPMRSRIDFDFPCGDVTRLTEETQRLLAPWWPVLSSRSETLSRLTLTLTLDLGGRTDTTIEPAEPTRTEALVIDLVRRRLEHLRLSSGATSLTITLESTAFVSSQTPLITLVSHHESLTPSNPKTSPPERDLTLARQALARLRAEYGERAVVRAVLSDAHLPEASFYWQPTVDLSAPDVSDVSVRVMVRRFFTPAILQPARSRHCRDDGWIIGSFSYGPVTDLRGPYIIDGGWWARGVCRHYHFAQTRRGDLLWLYEDRARHRWMLHGVVE